MENDRNTWKSFIWLPVWARSLLPQHWYSHLARRLLDVLAAALGLLLLSPVFALLSYLIKRDSSGPVFFRGPRTGRGGRIFQILKFRSMLAERRQV